VVMLVPRRVTVNASERAMTSGGARSRNPAVAVAADGHANVNQRPRKTCVARVFLIFLFEHEPRIVLVTGGYRTRWRAPTGPTPHPTTTIAILYMPLLRQAKFHLHRMAIRRNLRPLDYFWRADPVYFSRAVKDEVFSWMHRLLRAWVQRCKLMKIERKELGIRVELETQDDHGYYEYRFEVFPRKP
jgi:hypothetical protein